MIELFLMDKPEPLGRIGNKGLGQSYRYQVKASKVIKELLIINFLGKKVKMLVKYLKKRKNKKKRN